MKPSVKPPHQPIAAMPLGDQPRLWQALESSQQRQLAQCLARLLQRLAQDEAAPKEAVDEPV